MAYRGFCEDQRLSPISLALSTSTGSTLPSAAALSGSLALSSSSFSSFPDPRGRGERKGDGGQGLDAPAPPVALAPYLLDLSVLLEEAALAPAPPGDPPSLSAARTRPESEGLPFLSRGAHRSPSPGCLPYAPAVSPGPMAGAAGALDLTLRLGPSSPQACRASIEAEAAAAAVAVAATVAEPSSTIKAGDRRAPEHGEKRKREEREARADGSMEFRLESLDVDGLDEAHHHRPGLTEDDKATLLAGLGFTSTRIHELNAGDQALAESPRLLGKRMKSSYGGSYLSTQTTLADGVQETGSVPAVAAPKAFHEALLLAARGLASRAQLPLGDSLGNPGNALQGSMQPSAAAGRALAQDALRNIGSLNSKRLGNGVEFPLSASTSSPSAAAAAAAAAAAGAATAAASAAAVSKSWAEALRAAGRGSDPLLSPGLFRGAASPVPAVANISTGAERKSFRSPPPSLVSNLTAPASAPEGFTPGLSLVHHLLASSPSGLIHCKPLLPKPSAAATSAGNAALSAKPGETLLQSSQGAAAALARLPSQQQAAVLSQQIPELDRLPRSPSQDYTLLYRCHVCGKEFAKPQALGGHMHCHKRTGK